MGVELYDMLEPCSDSGAFVAELREKKGIDMEKCKRSMESEGYTIEFSSEVIHLAEDPNWGIGVGVYPSGKLLFKTTEKEKANKLLGDMAELIEDCIID